MRTEKKWVLVYRKGALPLYVAPLNERTLKINEAERFNSRESAEASRDSGKRLFMFEAIEHEFPAESENENYVGPKRSAI